MHSGQTGHYDRDYTRQHNIGNTDRDYERDDTREHNKVMLGKWEQERYKTRWQKFEPEFDTILEILKQIPI